MLQRNPLEPSDKIEKNPTLGEEKLPITPDGFVLTKGVDTYVEQGKVNKTLAMHKPLRDKFNESHPLVFSLLKRENFNPLLEEGLLNEKKRNHQGEFYLTHEAIALLVKHKILNHSSKRYDKNNIFVIHEEKHDLSAVLKSLSFKNHGDNAKIIHISMIHATTMYFRNIHGKIYGLMIDSEPRKDVIPELVSYTAKVLPEVMIFYNTAYLQMDYFSCSTFAIKCLMYFCKQGDEVFEHIKKSDLTKKEKNIYALSANILPAPLWKLTQRSQPDEKFLNSVVSQNKKMTLDNYLKEHSYLFSNRFYNLSAIRKKYHFFEQLEGFLETQLQDQEKNKLSQQLPSSLQKIVDDLGGKAKDQEKSLCVIS